LPRLIGINHVAVEVGDVDEAIAFFEQLADEVRLRGRIGSKMAFVDMGDQFVAISAGRTQEPDRARHIGLVVDDREEVLARARAAGAEMLGDNDFLDPWGNNWQVVAYQDIQFTKAPEVLRGMELDGLEKSESALAELRAKGISA
jgi:catechol 2,3-dioxygenase-like lactoylglutathione lyase family enzyme